MACQQHSADLIVVGSRGLGNIERMVLGSVSEFVANNAKCPVIIVRGSSDITKPKKVDTGINIEITEE